jgi:hypothetical protein
VVEGLCELFAHLYLKGTANEAAEGAAAGVAGGAVRDPLTDPRGPQAQEAAKFLKVQLLNEDPVYGGGLRLALAAFEKHGSHLASFVEHVKLHKSFPYRNLK